MATEQPSLSRRLIWDLFTRPAPPVVDRRIGPFRGELLGSENLASHARDIARRQRIAPPSRKPDSRLLERLDDNRRHLEMVRDGLTRAIEEDREIGPAGEWLLDNFYIVLEHAGEVRASMPRGYYQELPKLASGHLEGSPRVYEVAIDLIAHTEGHLEAENVGFFVSEFQRVSELTMGELWAIPTMLRLGLVENIRRLAARVINRLEETAAADSWADRIQEASSSPHELAAALAAFTEEHPRLTPTFVARFLQHIRGYQRDFKTLIRLEQWMTEEGPSPEDALSSANQAMALTQVMIANSITSLRMIARHDWTEFFEAQSRTERILRQDPAGVYPAMTFQTRDRYRHVVEELARRSGQPETGIAETAVEKAATAAADTPEESWRSHVGYFLVDDGRTILEEAAGFRVPAATAIRRGIRQHAQLAYFGSLGLATALLMLIAQLLMPVAPMEWRILAGVLTFIPATAIATALVNQIVAVVLPPTFLPKLDFVKNGISEDSRTAIVVPVLLAHSNAVIEALDHLERQFLANRDPNIQFAILGDFTDAQQESLPGDQDILRAAAQGISRLNQTYASSGGEVFHFLHRPRRWNPSQRAWMGWERKRGKLGDFNAVARGDGRDAFGWIYGAPSRLKGIRYVLTLDSDTVLPPTEAAAMVGTMAHPLNRAVLSDRAAGPARVIRGYGILQPRINVSLTSAHRSYFAHIFSGHPGVDPYTVSVSDVYQDLFCEGSYTGKGIYDVEVFTRTMAGQFPENALLSHDLIEGIHARAALATDLSLFDDFPRLYLTWSLRKHRWMRGDWQLLPWLWGRSPAGAGTASIRLSLLSRWKIADNLRRSLEDPALLVMLVAGWIVLPGTPLFWTFLVLGAMAAPLGIPLVTAALRPPWEKSWRPYYRALLQDGRRSVQQFLLAVCFLPDQALLATDAIVRTIWRVYVSRRRLLEWHTASQVEHRGGRMLQERWRRLAPALALTATIALLVVIRTRMDTGAVRDLVVLRFAIAALPLIVLWGFAPRVMRIISRPTVPPARRLRSSERRDAFRYAALHWQFYETFVSEKTQWLAPDNYQEEPGNATARRTSPTNIGLQLLALVSARDFGFITTDDMINRLDRAFRTLERMARYRGHFHNWYDLETLAVLEPGYISTVDSGNMAGHLVALRQACLQLPDSPLIADSFPEALQVGLVLAERALEARLSAAATREERKRLEDVREQIRKALDHAGSIKGPSLDSSVAGTLEALRDTLTEQPEEESREAARWLDWAIKLLGRHEAFLASMPHGSVSLRDAAQSSPTARALVQRLDALADRALEYVLEMEFGFLYDHDRKLFAIGLRVPANELDPSRYDLLASEARLASFMAIAKGDISPEHWFRLGRALTETANGTALVSWSGSMFEYLMPRLVLHSIPFTLLDQTGKGAVERHIAWTRERGVPWGVSESAYNVRDRHLTYQYRAFGVPDLALKRGLGDDLVIAPYATALALAVTPESALQNLHALEAAGALGEYGFCDAVDYTRPDPGATHAVVRTWMAHHIGMSLVAIDNLVHEEIWPERFHSEPMVGSVELLLQERIPRSFVRQNLLTSRSEHAAIPRETDKPAVREIDRPDTRQPRIALLGSLPYTVMMTSGGGGYSRFEQFAVTRWRADGTMDNWGQWCYVRDVETGAHWSVAHQPVCRVASDYSATFATDRVEFHRRDGEIETRTEITVVPQDHAEVRRVTVTNHSDSPRTIELTSYGELVLAAPDADRAHPAFGNLFIETEWIREHSAMLASRRPRSGDDARPWCAHTLAAGDERVGEVTWESDRSAFIGRGRSCRNPAALEPGAELGNSIGAVLDPIFAIRARVKVEPGRSASVAFTTLMAPDRGRAIELADRYTDPYSAQRALDLSWSQSQVDLQELGIGPADAELFQQLAGHLFFSHASLRPGEQELQANQRGQEALWGLGLSGDWPILLALIETAAGLPTLRQLLVAHHYWRLRGMTVDLLIINRQPPGYRQEVQDQVVATVQTSTENGLVDKPGGVFIRRADTISPDDMALLRATARVHIICDGLGLAGPMDIPEVDPPPGPREISARPSPGPASAPVEVDTQPHPNGFGRQTEEGAYEILLVPGVPPPAPWANVIANPVAGFCVTERGGGFSWAENSYFYRLTPWSNDPLSDPPGEVLYIRDEDSGVFWSATPAPVAHASAFTIRHEAGATTFQQEHQGIVSHLTVAMAPEDPVKVTTLRLKNSSSEPRQLTIVSYVEWTLGVLREHTQHQIRTWYDSENDAIFARNRFDSAFAGHVAFSAMLNQPDSYTADRREFIGRNGSLADPAALHRSGLAEATGAGLDPCAALQTTVRLDPGETQEITVLLGAATGEKEARDLVGRYRAAGQATHAVQVARDEWARRLSVIKVRTPDPAFDALVNHWSLYQALSCRYWARSAIYQSSGAYGFRDQLQDVMALVYAEPGLAREHILRAAGRQFIQGDVQHWWHPHSGRGVRTRFSDDLVWLPFAVEHYVTTTADTSILQENAPYLTMRELGPDEHEVYDLPAYSGEGGTIYDHCLRAFRRAMTHGPHDLPLMGGGDWNDGMNRVGIEGRGESVWLAWFLIGTARRFATLCEAEGDGANATLLRREADRYSVAADESAWDGEWYKRAWFDDGQPLGSHANQECRIDAIAQNWSVISGGAPEDRARRAMDSLYQHLVRPDLRLIALLTPPFDESQMDPGYIKGYLPGVRENGAQYTHAALWAVLAETMLGRGDRAWEMFQMLNPLTHSDTPEGVERYKVEPYVVASDVYTAEDHEGRGGWTWYTGSAAWTYRVALEGILGFSKVGDTLSVDPCIPTSWREFGIDYCPGSSTYRITVLNPDGISQGVALVELDGETRNDRLIPLIDDGSEHEVRVTLKGSRQ